MAAFGLDDVRESYTSDVTRFLAEVETSANIVVSAATLAIAAERTRRAPVESMVVGLHGIVGSSSLIGLDSMTGTARRLEHLAASAVESIRIMTLHATRLQRIAGVCLHGATELRTIVEHELAGRSADARSRSAALHARLDRTDHPVVAQDSTADLGWDEPALGSALHTSSPVPGANPSGLGGGLGGEPGGDDELGQAFADEARETLHNLQGHHARLAQQPDDDDAAAQCLRLLHLLRGSAAMVGRAAIASRTGELHAWLETVRRQGFTVGAVDALGRGIDDLAEQALGERPAPRTPAATSVAASGAPDDEPHQIFVEEAVHAVDELRALVAQVEATAGPAREAAAARAERLLHRLKGSALIVGEPQIAELATRGQALCEPIERVDPGGLAQLVNQLAQLVAPASADAPAAAVIRFQFAPPSPEEWEAYLEESSELLADLEHTLARLEQSARPTAELSAMFRVYHTLKGASSAVGLTPIAQQLHAMESFIERIVAAPELPALRAVVAALADEHAAIRAGLAGVVAHGVLEVDLARTTARLAAAGDRGAMSGASWIAANDPVWATPVGDPSTDGDREAHAPPSRASRHHASRQAGTAIASAQAPIADEDPAIGGEPAGLGRRFVRVAADRLDGLLDLVGELVVARSRILTRLSRMQHLQGEDQDRHGAVIRLVDDFATSTEFADLDGRGRAGHRARRISGSAGGAGFGTLELDHYEEIHVLSRQLDEASSDINEMRREITAEMQRLAEDAEALSTIVGGLQTEITQARMLTVDTLFTRLQLPIRDAAQRLGRDIEIVTHGDHVAIDKSISDALFGPLLHLVRNAVFHGIEAPARRTELGKPRAGVLSLSARHAHGQVVLEITDDGQGIDLARLKAAGVDKGLIDPAIPETSPRVLDLVFVHGLSTTDEAGDVAGRGVGGNVVRRAVERLSGAIEIETHRGAGTTFRITLPLSMSITQAVVIRTAGVTLAIPIAFAETILAREGVEAVDTFGRMRVQISGNLMPVHNTSRLFGGAAPLSGPAGPAGPAHGVLVVCVVGAERIAILADEVLGQEEIVVKSLGALLDGHPLFSGSTQRGDGELVLILDVPGVLLAETTGARAERPKPPEEPTQPAIEARRLAAPVEAAPVEAPPIAELTPLPAGRRRILFVDDSLSVRKVAERMLRALGVDVVTAIDGQDALDKLRTMAFSLVFTDLEMPRLHGYDLIREMQYLPTYRTTPVIVISSRSGQKHIDQALELGAREYLTKPFSPEILDAVLSRWAKQNGPVS